MKSFIAKLLILCFSLSLFSALPPFYQSKKEIIKLLNDERLHDKIGSGQPILDIIKTVSGWTVITPKYHLKVKTIYKPNEVMGPAIFDFEFSDLVEKN